jgi:2-polyprenyl-6-hydroxyphenyl methylase/3-demethylubiquinone-9 3-methyltransferase
MKSADSIAGYSYSSAETSHAHSYLLPTLDLELDKLAPRQKRIFDLGCGNGSVSSYLNSQGWEVTGVDPSEDGISMAKKHYPNLNLQTGSAYDDLPAKFGQFPVVISLEVVEHVYAPREYARTLFDLTEAGGTSIVSTPYHGYAKNLVMALTGKLDKHFTVLWDHGHIKFWSIRTLTQLLEEVGFRDIRFKRAGRIPSLAKSMVAMAKRPPTT